jgi:hypothetical protein
MSVSPPGYRRSANLIIRSNMNCHRLQNPRTIEHFWRLGSTIMRVKQLVHFCLHHPLSLPFGSLLLCRENWIRYTLLRLFNPLLFALLRVKLIVLSDVLSTSGVRASEKGLPKNFFVFPGTFTELR